MPLQVLLVEDSAGDLRLMREAFREVNPFIQLHVANDGSVLMKHAGSTEAILKALRAGGVQLAVDDFGTGYSSLSYLRKFPIDALKIDQSFVRQITTAPDETTIVTAVISMGRSLKLRVVAEGVEAQEELAFLQAHQCDEAQGYYFSRPVLPQQFAKLLQDQCAGSSVPPFAFFTRAARAASANQG
jgi:EAL domain-containing protein (putative c-di-GMP-specific phosphodiesterase class I)